MLGSGAQGKGKYFGLAGLVLNLLWLVLIIFPLLITVMS
jgi:hypothetical protein